MFQKLKADLGQKTINTQEFNHMVNTVVSNKKKEVYSPNKGTFLEQTVLGQTVHNSYHPWQLIKYSNNKLLVRDANWTRNGKRCQTEYWPTYDVTDPAAMEGIYDRFVSIETLGTDNYSTSTGADNRFNGFNYVVAAISSQAWNPNTYQDYMSDWYDGLNVSPYQSPNSVKLFTVTEADKDTIFSGINTKIDNLKKIVGAVKINDAGEIMQCYQYMNNDIFDTETLKPCDSWHCDMANLSYWMIAPKLNNYTVDGHTEVLAQDIVEKFGEDTVNLTIYKDNINYVYSKYMPCGEGGEGGTGVFSIEHGTSATDYISDSTSYRKLLHIISTVTNSVYDKQFWDTDIDYYGYAAHVEFNRGGTGALEYQMPNAGTGACSYRAITTAVECPE